MAEDRDKLSREAASLRTDFVPVIGDFKSFAEADDWIDYTLVAVGIIPGAEFITKPLKEAKQLLKAGDFNGVNKLIKEVSDGIVGHLPTPWISLPSSGVGSNAKFSVTNVQIGGNPSNTIDRQHVLDAIINIGSNPDKIVAGKFAGQGVGVGASRGDVFFIIKGNDVVVTKPDDSFVTILKDGITNNTSVKNALKGSPQ